MEEMSKNSSKWSKLVKISYVGKILVDQSTGLVDHFGRRLSTAVLVPGAVAPTFEKLNQIFLFRLGRL